MRARRAVYPAYGRCGSGEQGRVVVVVVSALQNWIDRASLDNSAFE